MSVDIAITDVTEGTLNGSGTFDRLMSAVTAHIDDQYNKGRIKGTDYANVYLGSIQSVIAESMQFALQEKLAEADIAIKAEQKISEQLNQDALVAKTKDDHGHLISTNGDDPVSLPNDTSTMHYHTIEKMKQDAILAAYNKEIARVKVQESEVGIDVMAAKAYSEYGVRPVIKYEVCNAVSGNHEMYLEDSNDGWYIKGTGSGIEDIYDASGNLIVGKYAKAVIEGTSTMNFSTSNADVEDITNTTPTNQHQAAMMKARVEANVGINTYKGYEADSYYKQYKSMQELLFSLANAGVENGDDLGDTNANSIYKKIVEAMEVRLNDQKNVWDNHISDIVLN